MATHDSDGTWSSLATGREAGAPSGRQPAVATVTPHITNIGSLVFNIPGALTGRVFVGSITKAQAQEIAEAKMEQLNANDVEAAIKVVAGSARSMGVEIKD